MKCGHMVDTDPDGRVCGQDRMFAPSPEQRAMGLDVIPVPCAGEFAEGDGDWLVRYNDGTFIHAWTRHTSPINAPNYESRFAPPDTSLSESEQ